MLPQPFTFRDSIPAQPTNQLSVPQSSCLLRKVARITWLPFVIYWYVNWEILRRSEEPQLGTCDLVALRKWSTSCYKNLVHRKVYSAKIHNHMFRRTNKLYLKPCLDGIYRRGDNWRASTSNCSCCRLDSNKFWLRWFCLWVISITQAPILGLQEYQSSMALIHL